MKNKIYLRFAQSREITACKIIACEAADENRINHKKAKFVN